MKSVLLSMSPYWWFLICEGFKKLEVRKTEPKSPDWDKQVFVYVTKDKTSFKDIPQEFRAKYEKVLGAVAGKFTCNDVEWVSIPYPAFQRELDKKYIELSCVRYYALHRYAWHDNLAFWDVSDVHSFDKPREFGEFIVPTKFGCCNEGKCKDCIYFDRGNGFNVEDDCNAPFCTDDYKPLRRPPQSWCYVEAVQHG